MVNGVLSLGDVDKDGAPRGRVVKEGSSTSSSSESRVRKDTIIIQININSR